MCRAERVTGPDAKPERVAVKRVNAVDGRLDRDLVEQEGCMLRKLQVLRNSSYTVPLYGEHLPQESQIHEPAYLIMG